MVVGYIMRGAMTMNLVSNPMVNNAGKGNNGSDVHFILEFAPDGHL